MHENQLSKTTFYCPNLSKEWLEKNGFRYNKSLSSEEDGNIYTMRFPVLNWNLYVTVEAEIMFNTTHNVAHINCFDKGTRSIYGAFYSYEYGNYDPVISEINKAIEKKINKIGLVPINEIRTKIFTIPKKRRQNDTSC